MAAKKKLQITPKAKPKAGDDDKAATGNQIVESNTKEALTGGKAFLSVDLEGSDDDMRQDLLDLIRARVASGPDYCYCSIVAVFTKDKYFIYETQSYDGSTDTTTHWQQKFTIGKDQEPVLNGDPVEVMIQFVPGTNDADTGTKALTGGGGLISKMVALVAGLTGQKDQEAGIKAFTLINDAKAVGDDGSPRLRFFSVASNNYVDRESELFTAEAHTKAIQWYEREQSFPELWVWHTKDAKIGQVDWMDFVRGPSGPGGLVVSTGLIDGGKEAIAQELASQDVAMSHGYIGFRSKEVSTGVGVYTAYLDYEQSVLPRSAVANFGTAFNLLEGGKDMPFTPERKKFLMDTFKLDDATVGTWEKSTDAQAASMAKLGIASKELSTALGLVDEPAIPAGTTVEGTKESVLDAAGAKEILGMVKALQDSNALLAAKAEAATAALEAATKSAAESAAAASTAAAAAGTSVVDAAKAMLTPRYAAVPPVAASEATATVVSSVEAARLAGGEKVLNNKDASFFGDYISHALGGYGLVPTATAPQAAMTATNISTPGHSGTGLDAGDLAAIASAPSVG